MNRLSILSTRALGAVTALVVAVTLTGCGPSNLIAGLRNPFASIGTIIWVALAVIALLDLFKSNRSSGSKLIWALVIIVMPFVGSILYYLMGRR